MKYQYHLFRKQSINKSYRGGLNTSLTGFFLYRYIESMDFISKLYTAFQCHRNLRLVLCCDMNLRDIPFSTIFPHPYGISIRGGSRFGENCVIRQNVTIGYRKNPLERAPIIGNNVHVCAGAIILGPVTVGDNVTIGAGSIVLADIPNNKTIVGIWKGSI